MSLIYQGNATTAAIQKGATGAQDALVIPFENSDNPAAYLEDVPNLRLIRINSDTNIPQYWDGTKWVVVGSNTGASVNFKIGDSDAPANGSTDYTLPDEFEGQAIEIFASDLGRFLIAGGDYSRSPTVTGLELTLLNGNQFLTGGYWNISGGKAIDGAQEVLDEAKAYTDEKAILKEKYTLYTEIPTEGQNALILCDQDNSSNGDNTESQFIRQNNKLFYLVAVEQ